MLGSLLSVLTDKVRDVCIDLKHCSLYDNPWAFRVAADTAEIEVNNACFIGFGAGID